MPVAEPTHRYIRMTTRLSPDDCLQRLTRTIEKQTPLFPLQPRPRTWLFTGTLDGYRFSICRIPAGKRIYANQIDGVIEPTSTGTSITLTLHPHRGSVLTDRVVGIVYLFGGLMIVGVPLYLTLRGQLPLNCGLFPLMVITILAFFFRADPNTPVTFDLDALTALEHLRRIFATEIQVVLDEYSIPASKL